MGYPTEKSDAQLSGGKRAMAGKILVVDDEPAIREMIGFALSRAGFSYTEAADAGQAEAEILNSFPDLILLDWMMPGQSGVDLIKRLRSDASTLVLNSVDQHSAAAITSVREDAVNVEDDDHQRRHRADHHGINEGL